MLRRTLRRRVPLAVAAALAGAPAALPGTAVALTDTVPAPTPAQREAQRPGPDAATLSARKVVAAARERIGSGYAMGASGPDAYDCSGLTAAAFAQVGIALPHSSFAQYERGEPVERDELRKGDLVFFSTAGPGASHVGIASGSRTVISATSSGGVIEHALDDGYWGSAYVGARRVAGVAGAGGGPGA